MSESPVVHLKGLNGIRALAATSVVISHIFWVFDDFGLQQMKGWELADKAVTMFFSLSGFLITYLLLIEKQKMGSINIRKFYLRRLLRIWPLYFFYLFLCIGILWIFQKKALPGSMGYYFFLSANIPLVLNTSLPLVFHYWSLAAEEQYYLFWPWVIKRTFSVFQWVMGFIVIVFLLKALAWFFLTKTGNDLPLRVINATRFHCMAIGALGAILFFQKNGVFLKIAFHIITQILVWILIVLLALDKFNISPFIDNEIVAVATVLLIVNVSSNPRTLIKLDGWYLDYVGKISFGIYVYHPLMIFLAVKALKGNITGLGANYKYAIIYFVILFGTVIVAALSYQLIEKPFLTLKERYSRVPTVSEEMTFTKQ